MRDTRDGQRTSVIILLSDQADVSAAYQMADDSARGWYVYRTLSDHADRTQVDVIGLLEQHGAPYQSFWVANAIAATCDRDLIVALAARSDVRAIESNAETRWLEPDAIANLPANTFPVAGVEWGVQSVRAPDVWNLGYKGAGIVVGNADTGMQWNHPALKSHYRGWNGTSAKHDYSWHDAIHGTSGNPCGNNAAAPCDDYGHGTHTTGTMIGDDGGSNKIGVAPAAKWIGCRNMDRGNGTPARYTECFQFFIAPTNLAGKNPDPNQRPHVINNSWGCTSGEGCAPTTLKVITENTQAAGIFVEASAGNSGPACGSVTDPPALYDAAYSTAAIDSGNHLASFSSRGAVSADGSNRRKPDIAAPGVGVRSSYPTSSYASLSGTSMAGPHVVGVVALLWSARPTFVRQITATRNQLNKTANPSVLLGSPQTCGGISSATIPNNSFGYGRIDALSAVQK